MIQFTGKPLTSNDFFCLFKKNNIHEFMGATVTVAKESASNAEVRKFLEDRGGPIESFTPQSSPGVHGAGGVGGKLKALVRFVDAQGAARAAALNGRHHEELRGSMLYLTPFFSCKFAVLRDLWAVLGEELLSLQAAIEVNNAGIVKFHVFPTEHSVTVRLSSSDPRELASARVMIEAVLKGEILHTSDGAGMGAGAGGGAAGVGANRLVPLWHETFAGPQGISLLKSFSAAASSPVFLLREENRRLVRCYGKPSDVALCRQAVLAYLAQYSQVVRSIPVKQPNLLNALLREGRLVELQRHSGAVARPIINFATMCLQVTGDNTVEQRAISFVLNLAAELKSAKPATTPTAPTADAKADSTEDEPICPICMCPVETGDTKQLECGHSYCIGCFDQYLAQAHSSYDAKFPLRCLHEHCGAPIPLFELEAALDIEQTAQMYRTALKCYVKQHPDRCNFCITPNCEQVYTWEGPADLVVQCSTCFASICTACKVEYHEGLTCAQYEERRNGGEAAYLQWKAAHNVKACPKCGVDIEKSEGCNHMQCANCKIHICWVCLKTFTDGRLTYDHMSSAHGGFFAQG